MAIFTFLFVITKLLIFLSQISSATDTITQLQPLPEGRTLVSKDGSFEMGFFSPGNNTNRYLGIWYKSIPVRTVVWVANRENPVKDNSSRLSINKEGKLVILSQNETLVWSANTTTQTQALSPIAQLLDTGNLVLRDEKDQNPQNYLWQSFDYPSDTFLPGMKIGWNLKTRRNRQLLAWKNWDDPSPGDFTQRYNWIAENQTWRLYSSVPRDNCDNYNLYGPYGNCIVSESPPCQCLTGFKPKSPQNYEALDWTQGCVFSEPWSCRVRNRDGFQNFSGLKLPDTTKSWVNGNLTLENCRAKCLENCSCTAYANIDVRGEGNGCIIWFGDLIDFREASVPGQDIYIRIAASETEAKGGHKKKLAEVIPIALLLVLVIVFTFSYIYWRKRKLRGKILEEKKDEGHEKDLELPFFDFATIVRATNDFSSDMRLGQGGFGPVYRGTLVDGQEIVVKKLSHNSGQGTKEFKNEVILCAKLQHRNLVKVLGCCVQGKEKVLIYEYMPNKSLDSYLFGNCI